MDYRLGFDTGQVSESEKGVRGYLEIKCLKTGDFCILRFGDFQKYWCFYANGVARLSEPHRVAPGDCSRADASKFYSIPICTVQHRFGIVLF